MKRRSQVPKYIEREEGKAPSSVNKTSREHMNFKKRDARRPRPATNKGRFQQGGWAAIKSRRAGG